MSEGSFHTRATKKPWKSSLPKEAWSARRLVPKVILNPIKVRMIIMRSCRGRSWDKRHWSCGWGWGTKSSRSFRRKGTMLSECCCINFVVWWSLGFVWSLRKLRKIRERNFWTLYFYDTVSNKLPSDFRENRQTHVRTVQNFVWQGNRLFRHPILYQIVKLITPLISSENHPLWTPVFRVLWVRFGSDFKKHF